MDILTLNMASIASANCYPLYLSNGHIIHNRNFEPFAWCFFLSTVQLENNHFISILEFLDKILTHLHLKWNHGDLIKKKSPKLERVVTHYCEFLCNFQSVTVEITIITGKFFTIFAYTSVVY